MLDKSQLEFIRDSLTAKGAAVACGDGGKIARLFVATLDEIEAQLKNLPPVSDDVKP